MVLFFMFLIVIVGLANQERGWAQVSSASFSFTGSSRPSGSASFRRTLRGEGLRLHPFLGVAEIYTDNVFKTNTNRRKDFVHTAVPGIQARLPLRGRHQFMVDYRAARLFHERFPQ